MWNVVMSITDASFLPSAFSIILKEKVSNWTNIYMRQRCFCCILRALQVLGLLLRRPESKNKKLGSVLQLFEQESILHRLLLFWCSSSTISGCLNNLWIATYKLLIWAKLQSCKTLDIHRDIKPNPWCKGAFNLLEFFQCQRWSREKVNSTQLGRGLHVRGQGGGGESPSDHGGSHQHSFFSEFM